MTCSLDLETRSAVDLLSRGAYVYAADPSTDVLLASYRLGDTMHRWRRGDPVPADLAAHVLAGGDIWAWNAAFERLLWWHVLTPRYGWPRPRLEQFRCTAAVARALSLPGSLDGIGPALGLEVTKDKAGKALIKKFSIPTEEKQRA